MKKPQKVRTSLSLNKETFDVMKIAQNDYKINISRWIDKIIKNTLVDPTIVNKLEIKEALINLNKLIEQLRELEDKPFKPIEIEEVKEVKEKSLWDFLKKETKEKR